MQVEMLASSEMSPETVKRLSEGVRLVMGRRSWAVTLQPFAERD